MVGAAFTGGDIVRGLAPTGMSTSNTIFSTSLIAILYLANISCDFELHPSYYPTLQSSVLVWSI